MRRQPSIYIPHGGGPCFFMEDPHGIWTKMEAFLHELPSCLPERPKAILLVSAHWETDGFAFTGAERPSLIYDYYNFPPHTYELRYEAPGDPTLAERAAGLLNAADLKARTDSSRGFDHGVFIPLKVAFPDADIPIVEMSLDHSLDPALHIAAGKALAPLRDEGIVIIASGMSFHNMQGFGDPRFTVPSEDFDNWLTESLSFAGQERDRRLERWQDAPAARLCHPREEHLLPLMVAAGASDAPGERVYDDHLVAVAVSAFEFA